MSTVNTILASLIVGLVGCASSSAPEAPTAPNVKARLATQTKLLVTPETSTASLTASRYTRDGWQDGTVDITIANGELDGKVDASGQLTVDQFSINVDPIDIPESVFGKPVEIKDARLVLLQPATAQTTWSDDDDATASLSLSLQLQWTLVVDGNSAPLGGQKLPPIAATVTLSGSGADVEAAIRVDASGELWSWADLFKLKSLTLHLEATSEF
ncbi:MAG: hypothetical protein ACM31C_18675 [Acidobacteriota bacterium]